MKKPKSSILLSESYRALEHFPDNPDSYKLPIGWNFSLMDKTDRSMPWHCTYRKLSKYRDKLLSFEGSSFAELIKGPSNHSWSTDEHVRFDPRAREQLKRMRIPEDSLWQLRLGSKERLFGVRQHNIFKILWLDEEHQVCKVEKKHT